MAVIQKLRNSGWVAVVIVTALVLFVVGDWISGKNSVGGGNEDADVVAIMNSEKVREKDLDAVVREVYQTEKESDPNYEITEKNRGQLFTKAWTELTKRRLLYTEIAKAGIEVSDEDYNEMMVGLHPDESIKGDPSFQTNNQFDPKKVEQIFRQAKGNAQMKARLADYVRKMKDNELTVRYSTYISKASYKSKAEKKYEYISANQAVSGKIVSLDINSIPDKDIKVTDDDLSAYLDEYKEKYKYTQEARNIKYVVFDIVPTRDDSAYAYNNANSTAAGMRAQTTPDSVGAIGYIARNQLPEDAPAEISNLVWNAPMNMVIGPVYREGKFYIWQKIREKLDTTGFMRASHILIPMSGKLPDGTDIKDSIQAQMKAIEVFGQLKSGAKMEELAGKYSTDQGSAKMGGDLGYQDPSKYVPEFGAFCKQGKAGETNIVKTQYGFHIIRITGPMDYTKIKFFQNEIEISAGQKTVKVVDEKSRNFKNSVKNDFDKAVEKGGIVPRVLKDFTTDQKTIVGVDAAADTRTILFWLFDKKRKSGDVSEVFAFSNKQVIVKVENIKNIGYATLDNVRSEIEPLVRSKMKSEKAAAKMADAMKSNKTAEQLATAVKGMVVSLDGVRFGQNFVPNLGQELQVLGVAFGAKVKSTSIPFASKSVAGVLFIDKRDDVQVPTSVYTSADQMDFMNQPQYLSNRITEVLNKSANIQDYRYKFEWNQ